MKTSVILATSAALSVSQTMSLSNNNLGEWHPSIDGVGRGPCPGLNTLANHGLLPRDGENITADQAAYAMGIAFNLEPGFAKQLWRVGVDSIRSVDPTASNDTLSLEGLRKHGGGEHDGSLTRPDYGQDKENYWRFTQSIYDYSRSFWPTQTVGATDVARSWVARQSQLKKDDPEYKAPNLKNICVELGALFMALGDAKAVTVDKSYADYLFEQERLPTALGWTTSTRVIDLNDALWVSGHLGAEIVRLEALSFIRGTAHDFMQSLGMAGSQHVLG